MTEITSRLSTALADRYKIERHLGEGGMAFSGLPSLWHLSKSMFASSNFRGY